MKAFLFAAGDFLRASLPEFGGVLLWILSLALVLLSATALWGLPLQPPAGPVSFHRLFLLNLSPLLSEQDINELTWQIWAWPEVKSVSFRFPGENDPEPVQERGLVVEASPETDGHELLAKLGKLVGVVNVTVWERTVVPPRIPSAARIGAVAALLVGLALSLFLAPRVLRRVQSRWKREQELLRRSGASPLVWRGPVILLAVLAGLLGAGLHLVALAVGVRFVPTGTPWTELLSLAVWAMGLGFPVGVFLALLGVLISPHS